MLSWDDFEEKEVKPLPKTEIESPLKEELKKSVSKEETLGVASVSYTHLTLPTTIEV